MPNSLKITNVKKLAEELHASKVINLDVSVKDLLNSAQGIGIIGDSPVADNAVAWSDYVVVTKGKLADISQLEGLKGKIGETLGR